MLIYGVHAALAALANPRRRISRLWLASTISAPWGDQALDRARRRNCPIQRCRAADIDRRLAGRGRDAAHQGLLVETAPLPEPSLKGIALDEKYRRIIACDRIVDPRNLGAIARSALVLGADALVMTRRHAPPLDGALAKAASGALERLPCLRPANLRQSLRHLQDHGFFVIGLAEEARDVLVPRAERIVIVLGAEHQGLRRLTREQCDQLARIPMAPRAAAAGMDLNVANTAAIALYILGSHRDGAAAALRPS